MAYDLDLSWNERIGWTFVSRSSFFNDGVERFNGSECSCDLMQFTGLKDRNGKPIYEGDIVCDDDNYFEVVFKFGGFEPFSRASGEAGWPPGWVEVVGDIYSTPELLNARP
jgi:hypothetical protein